MRKISLILTLLSISLLGIQAQTLEDVLSKHFKAAGQSKMEKVSTVKAVASMQLPTMGGAESPMTIMQALPDKFRVEMEMMGAKVIQTFNGVDGWTYAPAMGFTEPQKLSDEELAQLSSQTPFGSPLAGADEKGITLSLEECKDADKYKIKLTTEGGDESFALISKESNLIHSVITIMEIEGSESKIILRMKDYKSIKGVQIAHYIETSVEEDIVSVLKFSSVTFNEKLDPSLFDKPVVQ